MDLGMALIKSTEATGERRTRPPDKRRPGTGGASTAPGGNVYRARPFCHACAQGRARAPSSRCRTAGRFDEALIGSAHRQRCATSIPTPPGRSQTACRCSPSKRSWRTCRCAGEPLHRLPGARPRIRYHAGAGVCAPRYNPSPIRRHRVQDRAAHRDVGCQAGLVAGQQLN